MRFCLLPCLAQPSLRKRDSPPRSSPCARFAEKNPNLTPGALSFVEKLRGFAASPQRVGLNALSPTRLSHSSRSEGHIIESRPSRKPKPRRTGTQLIIRVTL